ncbi:MAG: helix-turn-helix transcriptional regulator [Clostridiales bacterium]|nr:helix-turn-helix transcriptional regulator [Clostridiales bacterium]
MAVSYKKLWKLLIDKEMMKKDLQKASGVSWGVMAKLSKNETVNMESLIKVCRALECTVDDVMDILPEEDSDSGVSAHKA